MLERQTV